MKLTDSDDELYKQLVDALYGVHPAKRVIAHWVMTKAWRDRIKTMHHAHGPADVLLGKPVKVADDGGAPHLEVPPQREMVPVEVGQDVIYLQCYDPACPDVKPGTHHAHLQRPAS